MMREARMHRVLVAGISGAGKTTLAKRVSAILGLPHHELDALYHGPEWRPRAEFAADVAAFSSGEQWICDGHYRSQLGDVLWERADTVLWLDLPRGVVMRRVIPRTFIRLARRRSLWNGNRERWRTLHHADHPIRWAWSQHARRRHSIGQVVEAHPHLHVERFTTPGEVERWVRALALSRRP